MGKTDKAIRVVIALALAALYILDILTGTLGIIAVVIAAVFLLTSLVGICPLYSIFGIRTCPAKN
jgi:hypothetical protein